MERENDRFSWRCLWDTKILSICCGCVFKARKREAHHGSPEAQGFMSCLVFCTHLASAVLKTRPTLNGGVLNAAGDLCLAPNQISFM